jgi:linoleoyl-CoA desaturase
MVTPKFAHPPHSFHTELKKRINDYFKQSGKSLTGNFSLYLKAVILLIAYIAIYIHLVFYTPTTWLALVECIILGGLTAAIGFNIMHDGMHGSFSKHKWLNNLAGLTLNFLGANNFMWRTKHNIIHHTYTNIHGIDDDIEAKPLLRLCETQKYYKIHRFQHWYFWAAYSLLYIWWVFVTDYKKYFLKRIGSVPLKKMSVADHLSFWGFKLLHAFIFIALPIYMLGFVPWLIGFLALGLFSGFVLSIVFQLAHTVEDTKFPAANETTHKMEDEWAIHQLKTTANFATKSKLISWWVGGLNFQIEHHLFPRVSHIHYPAISKIVRETCEKFDLRYNYFPTMAQAVHSHFKVMDELGQRP